MTFLNRCFFVFNRRCKLQPMCLAETMCIGTGTNLEDLNPSLREYVCTCSRKSCCPTKSKPKRRGSDKKTVSKSKQRRQGIQWLLRRWRHDANTTVNYTNQNESTPSNVLPPTQSLFDVAYGVVFKTWEKDQFIQQVIQEWDDAEKLLVDDNAQWYGKAEYLANFYKVQEIFLQYVHETPDPVTELKDTVVDISATAMTGRPVFFTCKPDSTGTPEGSNDTIRSQSRWWRKQMMRQPRCDCCSCSVARRCAERGRS